MNIKQRKKFLLEFMFRGHYVDKNFLSFIKLLQCFNFFYRGVCTPIQNLFISKFFIHFFYPLSLIFIFLKLSVDFNINPA